MLIVVMMGKWSDDNACGMFVMYCMSIVCPCQLFCSAWMCCFEEVYKVCNCNMLSVVNVYLDHLKFCVLMLEGMSVVVNVMLSLMSPHLALCQLSVRLVVKLCTLGVFTLGVSLVS